MKFAKCLENRRFPCYNNTNAKSVPSGAQANRTGSGRAYMNCAEIRRLPWLIRLLTSALLAALVLTPAPLALSASRTRPLSMLLLVLTAVLAKVLAPLVQSSRNNHSVPNPLCSVCCAGDFLMQKFIDDLIQALVPGGRTVSAAVVQGFCIILHTLRYPYPLYRTLAGHSKKCSVLYTNYTAAWSIPAKFRRTIGYGRQGTE